MAPPANDGSHQTYLELCARSAAGLLSIEEQRCLDQHLACCVVCRQALKQYRMVVDDAIPVVAAKELRDTVPGPAWSEEVAEAALFQRIARGQAREKAAQRTKTIRDTVNSAHREPVLASQATWQPVWSLYAAAVILLMALGVTAYRVGVNRGVADTRVPPSASTPDQSVSQARLSDAGHERELARAQMAQREHQIAELRRQLQRQEAEMNEVEVAQGRLEKQMRSGEQVRQDLLVAHTELEQKLASTQAARQALERQLGSLQAQTSQDMRLTTVLETRVAELTQTIAERDASIEQQRQLLAHDRDIRELMGARDLYIAEVYDVARTGVTQKPYGRVFYTKGKSLVFYAYDLDADAVKSASTFQAWGRSGADQKQALNLGIFYTDNAEKRRWVLKVDDARTLAAIDAVFVTVEPKGGSRKPSGKSLLFASLKSVPNHP